MACAIEEDCGGRDMSFSIDRYKEESRKVDMTGVNWEAVRDHELSKGDLFFLHYAMDIENHVPLYLSHLLVTRACMNPIITSFLSCWAYEELWHGEYIAKFLNLYGIEFDADTRIRNIRGRMGVSNTLSILSTMTASWLTEDFAAVYLTIGAINELTTATSYGILARKAGHPVLADILSRIQKDERRHFAFYYNSAKAWLLEGGPRAQRLARWMIDRVWVPVGLGVKTQEEVDAIGLYLFRDEPGRSEALAVEDKIRRLPGFSDVRLLSKWVESAEAREASNPDWGWRLIEREEWAGLSRQGAVRLQAGAEFGRNGHTETEVEPEPEAVG
jgi:hypothetical protein